MFKFYEDWKARKKLEKEVRWNENSAWENKRRDECRENVESSNSKMLSKFCPAINDLCRKECVNFSSAYFHEIPDWLEDGKSLFREFNARCRLWTK